MTAAEWNARYPEGTRVIWVNTEHKTVDLARSYGDRAVVKISPGLRGEPTAVVFVDVLEVIP
jgi:hypothetical protein